MAADEPIPVFKTILEAHPIPSIASREAHRYAQLTEHYTSLFGHPPTYIARAPGRVNIIGEHIDYALFGVCPMAVEQDVLIACAPRLSPETDVENKEHGHVEARNLHPKYTPQSFKPTLKLRANANADDDDAVHISEDPSVSRNVQWHLEIDKTQLRWESYVKAGYYGVLERFFSAAAKQAGSSTHAPPKPVDILVTGSVPAGSGLSSSAAMVVASTLAFLAVNDKLSIGIDGRKLTKGELVEMAVENEKRVGVNSGGMDQAASVTSLPTSALYISFFPYFSSEPVLLPITRTTPKAVFVCANSLVVSDKVVGAKTRYNLRVVETLVSARILARALNLSALLSSTKNKKFTLREVLAAYLGVGEVNGLKEPALTPEEIEAGLAKLLNEVEKLKGSVLRCEQEHGAEDVDKVREEEGLTMDEMVRFSGLDEKEFREAYLGWVDVEATHFQLYKRTQHVLSEALRVLQFRSLCLSTSVETSLSEDTLHNLGQLMNASQESCSKLFECSCPELDELTRICREMGAYGSRLTGAGWGGCTISLVPAPYVEKFIADLREAYEPYRDLSDEQFGEAVFKTESGSGAFIFKIEE